MIDELAAFKDPSFFFSGILLFHFQIWCSPRFRHSGCSIPDPPHPSPPGPLVRLPTSDFLTSLLSVLQSPQFPRQTPIVAEGHQAVRNPIGDIWGANPSARPHQRTTIRGSTQQRPAPTYQVPPPATRYQVPVPSYEPFFVRGKAG